MWLCCTNLMHCATIMNEGDWFNCVRKCAVLMIKRSEFDEVCHQNETTGVIICHGWYMILERKYFCSGWFVLSALSGVTMTGVTTVSADNAYLLFFKHVIFLWLTLNQCQFQTAGLEALFLLQWQHALFQELTQVVTCLFASDRLTSHEDSCSQWTWILHIS